MKIVADAAIPFVVDYFAACSELILLPGRDISAADVKDADVLLVRAVTKVNAELLGESSVRFVGSVTAGLDHLDTAWLESQKIAYSATPGFNAPAVADYVVSVVAALQRRQLFPQYGARAAVIGVGHCGSLVAQRLTVLGIDVLLCDPVRAAVEPDFLHHELEKISGVNLISLHVPLTMTGQNATYHMIDQAILGRQQAGCVILNASRGDVLTENALHTNNNLQVCFDVYSGEPNISLENLQRAVITTPHIAGYSVQSQRRGIEMLYQMLRARNIIVAAAETAPATLPRQQLTFAGRAPHWQDIILGIFNPLLLTTLMRYQISSADNIAAAFDAMRKAFNYRHELACTDVIAQDILPEDRQMLERLGVSILTFRS